MGVKALAVLAIMSLVMSVSQAQLKPGFYDETCPGAEHIIKMFVDEHIPHAPPLAAALLRMHFHDCFVRGCDASVLLNSSSNTAERDAIPNGSLRGFDFIDRVKALLEAECPGVVSCADVLALVARDAVVATGGPSWNVATGRRDGSVSLATEANTNLPPPSANYTALKKLFANKTLDEKDLVVLSGAHTIGISHCGTISTRIYNYSGAGDVDPSMDPNYAANLKARKCKTISDTATIIEMDPGSFTTFDTNYYTNLIKRRGLFPSDQALLSDSTGKSYVDSILKGPPSLFFSEFAVSMEKMNHIGVLTGTQGQVRKTCAKLN